MALAYTPGLKVKAATIVRKERKLPIPGDTLVKLGDAVSFDTAVARTMIPGEVRTVNVAGILGLDALQDSIEPYMRKREGEEVEENAVIATRSEFFGLSKSICRSPIKGKIERISVITGQVDLRAPPVKVEVPAYIPGKVVNVLPREGVIIEVPAAYIQGIIGIGGETYGKLMVVANSSEDVLTADKIKECAGKIAVGGASVTCDALHEAVKMGVRGVVVGGIDIKDLKSFMGYTIGVAITGNEKVGLTLIITEGFGKMNMASRTFELLKSFNGREASINGATQIRAGVIRPEIIIPREDIKSSELGGGDEEEIFSEGMTTGMRVRVIREPYFGALGNIVNLTAELQEIETESHVRVLEVELDDGQRVIVPRANVEIIEE